MPDSILDAIKLGIWDYEPEEVECAEFKSTFALPGTDKKLAVLAQRLEKGLPLWHEEDRQTYDESCED